MSSVYSTHYSCALNPPELIRKAGDLAEQILAWCKENGKVPILVYSGMSGVALATAISLYIYQNEPLFKFQMAYIRKADEKAHGGAIEYSMYTGSGPRREWNNHIGVFIDDMIDSGATFNYCKAKFEERFSEIKIGAYALESGGFRLTRDIVKAEVTEDERA